MSVVKKQHYVPQGYLRRFANASGQLYVFDKYTRRSFVSAVHDVANSNYFYDFGPDVVEEIVANIDAHPELGITPEQRQRLLDPQLIEHHLGENVDARFPRLLDEIVQAAEHEGAMTEEQRRELSVLLSVQLLRLPRHRQYLIEMYEKTVRGVSQRILAMQYGIEAMDWVRVKFDKKYAAAYHGQTIFNSESLDTYFKVLAAHIWRIGRNGTDQAFYTSDHPVVLHSHLNQGSYGIGSPGIEICFPLGSQYMLMLCDRNIFASYAALDRKLVPLTEENVTFFNSLQVNQCTRQVFCSKGQYMLAAEMCAADPSLSVPRKELLITN
jgi:Protein of unknown function (DUF4238)